MGAMIILLTAFAGVMGGFALAAVMQQDQMAVAAWSFLSFLGSPTGAWTVTGSFGAYIIIMQWLQGRGAEDLGVTPAA